MTPFNPENKENPTMRDLLDPAMKITDTEDAKQYKDAYIAWIQQDLDKNMGKNSISAEQIAKTNLGYYAGYYGNKTRERVEKLFMCEHPFFGSIKKNGAPTAEEALEIGKKLGEKSKKY